MRLAVATLKQRCLAAGLVEPVLGAHLEGALRLRGGRDDVESGLCTVGVRHRGVHRIAALLEDARRLDPRGGEPRLELRLGDGAVVFLDEAGGWTTCLAGAAVGHGEREAEILLRRGQVEGFSVVEPFLVAVSEDDDGTLEPLSLREKIRASGLTFEAIAAEAVRYA